MIMCLQNESKGRNRLIALGAACLAAGLLLPQSFHPAGGLGLNLLHFVSGLLIGISLSVNLMAVWKASRKRRSDSL